MGSIPRLAFAAVVFGFVLLYACHDSPEISEPSAATAVIRYQLTITGTGTGTGVVTSSPAGINCTLTAGRAAATGCTALYNDGTYVTLTAKPASGSAFGGWVKLCTGLGTCTTRMRGAREVSAMFRKGPFVVKISSGTSGVGTGRAKSQTALTPAINCQITNGVPATTGCSATYPANTKLTLTTTPATNFYFAGWRDPSCSTGSCQYTLIQNTTIPVTFARVSSTSPAVQGKWSGVINTPVVGVHAHLMPTGKVFMWGDVGEAQLWDPDNTAAGFASVTKTYRSYCTGHTFLPD